MGLPVSCTNEGLKVGNGSKYVYVDVCSKSAHVQERGGMGAMLPFAITCWLWHVNALRTKNSTIGGNSYSK